jgi:sugar lactone lactonase YvrE
VWDDRRQELVWVDILRGEVHRTALESGTDHFERLGTTIGAVALCKKGGLVAAAADGFCLLDADGALTEWLWRPAISHPGHRMNDGKCDPGGRFLAGTMTVDRIPDFCELFCLEADHSVRTVVDSVTLSNGMAWSLDGTTMYYIDTVHRRIDAFDYDLAAGVPSGRRPVVAIEAGAGNPDGMTIDAEGYLWVALAQGAAVRRYAPDGRLDRTLSMPVRKVTSVAFGGPALDLLVVTSACAGLSEADLVAEPLAGAVLCCRVDTSGVPASRFAD